MRVVDVSIDLNSGKAGPKVKVQKLPILCYSLKMEIEDRNRLRAESGLPLLDVQVETARLAAAREQAEFEEEWMRRRSEFAHKWVGNRDGWLTNMGRWSLARQQVRHETKKPSVTKP